MPVPEASMDENRLPPGKENDVGMTQKIEPSYPKTISKRMKKAPYSNLGFGIARADESHSPAPLIERESIHHRLGYENNMVWTHRLKLTIQLTFRQGANAISFQPSDIFDRITLPNVKPLALIRLTALSMV